MSGPGPDLDLEVGWVDGRVADEFPDLRLIAATVDAVPGKSPHEVRDQLGHLSDRVRGAQVVAMRQSAVPWAYRVFYRQVGLDPDAERTPIEAAALERLLRGAYKSKNLLDDALTIALVETGVPIWALDATGLDGPLGIRPADTGEHLGRGKLAPGVAAGRLVVADAAGPLAILFGEVAPGHGVTAATRRMTLFSLQVAGVPSIHVEEAMWRCVALLCDL